MKKLVTPLRRAAGYNGKAIAYLMGICLETANFLASSFFGSITLKTPSS